MMTEFAIEILASGDARKIASLVRRLVEKWPHLPALSTCFAITRAASKLERMFGGAASERASNQAYKLASLVASDVMALELMGGRSVTNDDILHYWHRADPFFLEL